MGEVANVAHGSMPDRDLAVLSLDPLGWSMEAAQGIGADPEAALARLNAMLVPAKDVEPNGLVDGRRGPKTDRLVKALAMVGAKISPTMAQEQMQAWIAAMTRALSDLPFAFAQKGAEDAIHSPVRFLNEVEGVVREKAEAARVRHANAQRRLRLLRRQMESESEPKLPPPELPPITQEGINAMPEPLRKMGLSCGAITQEQYDIATQRKDEP